MYNRFFDCVVADTDELLDEAYRLRYQVYCVENGFEDPAEHRNGLETDEFDPHSIHSLLIHRPSGDPAGAVRMILPWHGRSATALPIRQICHHPDLHDRGLIPPESVGEISRFSVSRVFRKRFSDDKWGGYYDVRFGDDRRRIPNLTLGLIRSLVEISRDHGLTHWCAMMEPTLLRLLRRLGIHFTPIGAPIEHHGRRQPCYADLDAMLARCRREQPEIWEVITDDGRAWPPGRAAVPAAGETPAAAEFGCAASADT